MKNELLMKSLGNVARVARERLGLTQAQVAWRIRLNPTIYSRIERGHLMPSVPTLREMALALDLSADVFLSLSRSDITPSPDAPTPQDDLSPEMRQTLLMLRGCSPTKVKWLNHILKAIENIPEDK
jgi:transcriptional regulator with XRE-family HTH domain